MYVIRRIDLRKESDINRLERDWRRLEQGSEMTIYQSFDWNRLMLKEELSKPLSKLRFHICVYVLAYNDKIKIILPIVVNRFRFINSIGRDRGIYILGAGSYSDYLNMIYKTDINADEFASLIKKVQGDFKNYNFYINDIRCGTQFMSYLMSVTNNYTCSVAVQINKFSSLEVYKEILSKSVRQNLRTSRNRMRKNGMTYNLKILEKVDDMVLIDKLMAIHIERMLEKNIAGVPRFSLNKIWLIYRKYKERKNNIIKYAMNFMEESRVIIVELNGDIAGYLYGLADRNTIRILQNCVVNKYKFYSPMFLGAYDYIIKELYNNGCVDVIDFTRGNEKYKYNLGGNEFKLYTFVI